MKIPASALLLALTFSTVAISAGAEDHRELVELPEMMQRHMMGNMRDHLAAIHEIQSLLAEEKLDEAADIAESRLGMSSLEAHGAHHMAKFMPEGMRQAGTAMHHAASRFARVVQEGEVQPALRALADVTAACMACHAGYRIR